MDFFQEISGIYSFRFFIMVPFFVFPQNDSTPEAAKELTLEDS
jgi:succinate dehydrogenase/fumarate reductase cytochrome b subunit